MNEADTRAELIDKQLEAAGWITNAKNAVRVRREYRITDGEIKNSGIRTGKLIADYVLEYKSIPLAVVEAKSNEVDVNEGVAQAKLYAQKLRLQTSFAANGTHIYEINHAAQTEGIVSSFPTPDQLWQRVYGGTNEWLERFSSIPFENINGTKQARYYQQLAVTRAIESIASGKDRVLLTLATGTGKTFIAFQIAWKLFKARWTRQLDRKRQPRILFLADRNVLADQAKGAFTAFEDDAIVRINPTEIAKKGEVPKNGSVFFTIFQTFMSGEDGKPYFGEYERDFFDIVIIDECHRGGANDESSWREILDYFSSAVHLGLTATPKRTDNANTYDYFGEPAFVYSLKEGIQDGYLTPFKVKRIQSTIDEYVYTSDDEVLDGEVKEGKVYTESDFNRHIVIEERERKRVEELINSINDYEKTLVFCANQAHAAQIRDMINQTVQGKGVDYCVRVTANDGAIGELYLKQFQDNERSIPTILTTSQKLTTGVDALNVRNVVLMRPITNMIEFKQIIGRGTRVFEGKHYFTIIDFVNAYQLFNDAEWDGAPVEIEETDAEKKKGSLSDSESKSTNEDSQIRDNDNQYDNDDNESIRKPKLRIKLSDGKVREIQTMSSTYFYVDGKPISAEEFLNRLFDTIKLPDLLGSEHELRKIWSNPMTRRELLKKLDAAGCYKDDLEKLQEIINAKDSDLFDVLEFIAYAKPPITRYERVNTNSDNIYNLLNQKQREFVEYVLRNYVKLGVDELDVSKLSTVLTAKYGSLHAAQSELGSVADIQKTFVEFQQKLCA